MSQVVNNKDRLLPIRNKSLLEEQKIIKASYISKWQMGDISKTTPIERVIGLVFLPVFLLWVSLFLLFSIGMSIALFILRGFSFVMKNKK